MVETLKHTFAKADSSITCAVFHFMFLQTPFSPRKSFALDSCIQMDKTTRQQNLLNAGILLKICDLSLSFFLFFFWIYALGTLTDLPYMHMQMKCACTTTHFLPMHTLLQGSMPTFRSQAEWVPMEMWLSDSQVKQKIQGLACAFRRSPAHPCRNTPGNHWASQTHHRHSFLPPCRHWPTANYDAGSAVLTGTLEGGGAQAAFSANPRAEEVGQRTFLLLCTWTQSLESLCWAVRRVITHLSGHVGPTTIWPKEILMHYSASWSCLSI